MGDTKDDYTAKDDAVIEEMVGQIMAIDQDYTEMLDRVAGGAKAVMTALYPFNIQIERMGDKWKGLYRVRSWLSMDSVANINGTQLVTRSQLDAWLRSTNLNVRDWTVND